MTRTFIWILGGIGLGIIIHLIVILTLPSLSQKTLWTRTQDLAIVEKFIVLDDVEASTANPFKLDPELLYGVCRLDLTSGVGFVNARLPDVFWSVSLFDKSGRALFGTTNRPGANQLLQLGVFNQAQVRQLSRQELNIPDTLLIVEADSDTLFAVIRLAPPHQVMRERYRELLSHVTCSHLQTNQG